MTLTPAVPGAINISSLTGEEIVQLQSGGQSTAQTTTQDIANLAGGGGTTGPTGPTGSGSTGPTGPTGSGGGGGNSITLTAGTNLAAGTAVAINSSGDAVQTWGPAPDVAATVTLGATQVPSSTVTNNLQAPSLILSAGLFVTFLNGPGDGPNLIGAVASTISGSAITVGALNTNAALEAVVVRTDALSWDASAPSAAALSATSFVMVYGSGSTVLAAVATVSGTAITVGTPVVIDSENGLYNPGSLSIAILTSTLAVITYSTGNNTTFVVAITISGTAITAGTPVEVVASNLQWPGGLAALPVSSTSFLLIYADGTNNSAVTGVIGTVATRTITLHTPAASSDLAGSFSPAQLSTSEVAIAGVQGNSSSGLLELLTISGTTVSFGASAGIPGLSYVAVLDSTHVGVFPQANNPNYFGSFYPEVYTLSDGTFSGGAFAPAPNGTWGVPVVASADLMVYTAVNMDPTGFPPPTFTIAEVDNNGNVSPGIPHVGWSGYWLYGLSSTKALATLLDQVGNLTAHVVTLNAINESASVGFVASGVTDGNPATVNISGLSGGFSGLSAGEQYYVNGDGSLTTFDTGYKAGVAVSSTEILIAA